MAYRYAHFRYNYAVACMRQGRMERAKTELDRILRDYPAYEPARRALDMLSAPPTPPPDLWKWWTGLSDGRRVLGMVLLGALAALVALPIVYLTVPSLDGPELPWQYYVAALTVVAGALVLPAVKQVRAFGVELDLQPLLPAEAQLEPVLWQ